MKVIEHIKPQGECTLKVKVWLLDKRIDFQVLKQKHRNRIFAKTPVCVESIGFPQLGVSSIYLRGSARNRDLDVCRRAFLSNIDRDAYYAKMKVALAAAAEAMK